MTSIGNNQHQPWTKDEIDFLKRNYSTMRNKQIVEKLIQINPQTPRSVFAIKSQAIRYNLKKGYLWQADEVNNLRELIGEYPLPELVVRHNQWCTRHQRVSRSKNQIKAKIKHLKQSVRIDASSKYLTTNDFALLLGSNRSTAIKIIRTYSQELGVSCLKPGLATTVKRKKIKSFLRNHQDVVERYQRSLDIHWLIDILTS